MAAALGYQFIDQKGTELTAIGENLSEIIEIKGTNPYPAIQFIVLSDVSNPLHGPDGAAHVYAKQKGANANIIKQLDKGLINMGQWLSADTPGAGAAGGLGAGAMYFLGARMEPGAEWLLNKLHINRAIRKADFVITGEGKIDQQSWSGKLVSNIVDRADKQLKQSILVCGLFEDPEHIPLFLDPREVYSITDIAESPKDAMENAAKYLTQIGEAIALKYL